MQRSAFENVLRMMLVTFLPTVGGQIIDRLRFRGSCEDKMPDTSEGAPRAPYLNVEME